MPSTRLLRLPQVIDRTGLGKTKLYDALSMSNCRSSSVRPSIARNFAKALVKGLEITRDRAPISRV